MAQHEIRVVKPETDIQAVKSPQAVVEQGRLPSEPGNIDRRVLFGFCISQGHRSLSVAADQGPDLNRFFIGKRFRIGGDNLFRFIPESGAETRTFLNSSHNFFQGDIFERSVVAA